MVPNCATHHICNLLTETREVKTTRFHFCNFMSYCEVQIYTGDRLPFTANHVFQTNSLYEVLPSSSPEQFFLKKKIGPRLTHYWIHAKYHCEDMKFSVKDFFGKSDQFGKSFLRIWSHLLKKFSMETFIFWCSLSVVSCDHLLFTPAKSISQFVIKVSVKHSQHFLNTNN